MRIYAEYLAGRALLQIAAALNADGMPTAAGANGTRRTDAAAILANPIYPG